METERNYASKGMAGTALGLSIGALGVEALRGGLNGLLGGNPAPAATPAPAPASNSGASDTSAAIVASMMPMVAAAVAAASGPRGTCNEDHTVNRYEAGKDARIAELETEIKLRDANTYTDGKMLDLYKYVDGRLRGVEGQISQQAVYNATNTAALNCMQGQINQLLSLTKIVVPNSSICPGWGTATVSVSTGTATA